MRDFILSGPNSKDYEGGVYLEFYAGVSTREIRIDKLTNGKWNLDIIVYGQRDMFEFETLDDLLKDLVETWWMAEDKVEEVKDACDKITMELDVEILHEWLNERDEEEEDEDEEENNASE